MRTVILAVPVTDKLATFVSPKIVERSEDKSEKKSVASKYIKFCFFDAKLRLRLKND